MEYPDYKYVDIHRVDITDIHYKWKRIDQSDIPKYIQAYENAVDTKHIFCTIQRFSVSQHTEDEFHFCDLYFDLDNEDDVSKSLDDARKLGHYFLTSQEVSDDMIKFWYSGNRGFHIVVDSLAFVDVGIKPEPSDHLTKTWRIVAENISQWCGLKTFDRTVYTKRRAWRVENTKHGKTGLYKIPLSPYEISCLSIDEIKDLARKKREWVHADNGELE